MQQGLAGVRAAAHRIWPQSTATLFGSQVRISALLNGLWCMHIHTVHSTCRGP